jgi:hypothetical protein
VLLSLRPARLGLSSDTTLCEAESTGDSKHVEYPPSYKENEGVGRRECCESVYVLTKCAESLASAVDVKAQLAADEAEREAIERYARVYASAKRGQ